MLVSSEVWAKQRNLNLRVEQEAFLYLLGRAAKGDLLPAEMWVFLAQNPRMWNHRPTEYL